MTRIILLSSLALSIAGCSPADIIEGKPSAAQQHQERMALVTMPAPAQPVVAVPEPLTVAVVEVVAQPVCSETFRLNRCVGGVSVDWFYGDAP